MSKKKIVITIGDPAGCGPYITLKAIENLNIKNVKFFVVGDERVLKNISGYSKVRKKIELIDIKTPFIGKIKKGYINKLSGETSLNYLKKALSLIEKEKIKGLVTAPVSKEAIKLFYPEFCGHTEFLAEFFKVRNFAMMMVSSKLKVVLFTRHLPLREVSKNISKDRLVAVIDLIYSFLKEKFRIRKPCIALASLNPHAGIDTFLDKEERIMKKAISYCRKRIKGPYPADTLFIDTNLKKFDCIICAYHDQAMIPFKLLSFQNGVNLTIGLPIIRTSPSHGVAFEAIKKKKRIFYSSMQEAIKLAVKLS
ncbi:MAG: 4-hydroxythreonine-4-phosphate dehydrogenase PdxA [Candidatus Omnitrophica bacterium 4484_70.1]|nr:MAG: 4-hydroxythreonine-4-phosphate dehydrogenase PdxA [Candidatus Omnitrophica bacterium 4484_70.1]